MYTRTNFKTKKALKEAVAAWNDYQANPQNYSNGEPTFGLLTLGAVLAAKTPKPRAPRAVRYYQPGPFGGNEPQNGTFCCEGPHYPEPHRWYASCEARDGVIVKVK